MAPVHVHVVKVLFRQLGKLELLVQADVTISEQQILQEGVMSTAEDGCTVECHTLRKWTNKNENFKTTPRHGRCQKCFISHPSFIAFFSLL